MNDILIHAWTVHKNGNNYYLPYTHWVYLSEIVKYYDHVCLLSPTYFNNNAENEGLILISSFKNVSVEELPHSNTYLGAIKFFLNYNRKYKKLRHFKVVYARYPIPFGWLQKVYLKNTKRIIHFVGDPIDAAKTNPSFNLLKKFLLISFFKPEHALFIWACKGASVYTNGFHLARRLVSQGIKAIPLISSTLKSDDFYFNDKSINNEIPKIIYVGYLRRAKGVETVITAFELFLNKYPKAQLTIVGSGEFENDLKELVKIKNIGKNVAFLGHIDDRKCLNELLRSHDIFCFASLSEGSPRVILEAMANGLNIISTPVGSLPFVFNDNEHLLYADFNDSNMFSEKMSQLISGNVDSEKIRKNAYIKVYEYTIESFIKRIFYEK